MKRIALNIFTLLIGFCLANACGDGRDGPMENPGSVKVTVCVRSEAPADVKALWNGAGSVWETGDSIGIFTDADDNAVFTCTPRTPPADAGQASFEGSLSYPADREVDIYSYYPYSAAASFNGGLLEINIPSTQIYTPAGFKGLPAVAYTRSIPAEASLAFRNLCSVLAMPLNTQGTAAGKMVLQQVIFEGQGGEAVAGAVSVDPTSSNPVPDYSKAASRKITLDCTAAGQLVLGAEPTTVYIGIPAINYPQGYKFSFVTDRGTVVRTARSKGASHSRNTIYRVPLLTLPDPALKVPDPAFRQVLSQLGYIVETGADGQVEVTPKGAAATELDVSGNGITDLAGIEYFPNLEMLTCSRNSLVDLDLSGNPNLVSLWCDENSLEQLDLSPCTALYELNCSANRLTQITGIPRQSIVTVDCSRNKLSALDFSYCTSLTDLNCSSNLLTSINITGSSALYSLNCSDNLLENLTIDGCRTLLIADCRKNPVRRIDISGDNRLKNLTVGDETKCVLNTTVIVPTGLGLKSFTADDISAYSGANYTWTAVKCSSDPTIETLSFRNCPGLLTLTATDNPTLTTIDLTGSPACRIIQSGNNPALTVIR